MAEETVDAAVKEFDLKPNGKCQTHHIKLVGSHAWTPTMYIKLIQQFGLETDVAKHLSDSYGDRAWTVASMSDPTGLSWPIHGERLHHLYPYVDAEARYAVRHEYALHASDFVGRRTRLSFLNVQATLEALPRIIEIMGEELKWDAATKRKEFDLAIQYLKSMGLPESTKLTLDDVVKRDGKIGVFGLRHKEGAAVYARSAFSPKELQRIKEQFASLDFDQDEVITRDDLVAAMKNMGYDADVAAADLILAEVDFSRKGQINFEDFLDVSGGGERAELGIVC
jgi:glycerol-3-phosphate dehydrogenase